LLRGGLRIDPTFATHDRRIGMRILLAVFVLVSLGASAEDTGSCRDTAGEKLSKLYVRQCTMVSPATHPPCNALNPCELITSEITRGCGMIHQSLVDHPDWATGHNGLREPKFCGSYLKASK
jgi:hypothetical protein